MLDDLNQIAEIDAQNALAVAAGQFEQLDYSDYKFDTSGFGEVENVVLVGMGGSALAGLLCASWWREQLELPFQIVRDYELPAYVGEQTLVIASSYSGNTEETVSSLRDAKTKGAQIVVMTSGGKLEELAEEHDYPMLQIPEGYQPRMAVFFGVRLISAVFEELGLADGALEKLESAQEFIKLSAATWVAEVSTENNRAKQIAQEILGSSPIVYGSPLLASAAYKWKISFNESSKNLAFWNQFSEFNHNEFMGWTSHPVEKPFSVIELRSGFDHPQISKRFDISNRLLSGDMPEPIQVKAEGETKIEQILWTVQLGDFVSLYLAILNGNNPTPVPLIEKLKEEL